MNVKVGSKTSNLTGFAFKRFKVNDDGFLSFFTLNSRTFRIFLYVCAFFLYQEADINQITWNGSGDALCKVVACAEIMKAKFKVIANFSSITEFYCFCAFA